MRNLVCESFLLFALSYLISIPSQTSTASRSHHLDIMETTTAISRAASDLGRLAVDHAVGNATITAKAAPQSTIAPYDHGLTGVDLARDAQITHDLWWSLGVLAMLILAIRLSERVKAQLRLVSTMAATAQQQAYWAQNQFGIWKLRKYVLYAPLWKKRHNREIRLSKAGVMGTIPSRLHTTILIGYGLSNIIYCVWLKYNVVNKFEVAAALRGRSGVLAIINMLPLIIFAGRNNPLIGLLQISFDTYNLFHRWIGRIIALESVIHTFAWMYVAKAAKGWPGVVTSMGTNPFLSFGVLGTAAMVALLLTSLSPVRHAFYETFLNAHIIMVMLILLGVMLHCQMGHLPQTPIVWAVIVLWAAERLARLGRLTYYNYSRKGWTNATISALPGEACRVTLHLPKHVSIKPGSHAYVRFGGINPWESHPFSIAWVDEKSAADDSVLPTSEKPSTIKSTHTDVSFIIHAQSGMTRKLFDKASDYGFSAGIKPLYIKAAFEGPYGGHHSLDSFGHAVLFAGSSGITHQLPYVRHLIKGYQQSRVATRKITLIWIIREPEHLEWVRPWMDSILQMQQRRDILLIKVYITRPTNVKKITSPSSTVQMFPGRPNIMTLVQEQVSQQVGAMCVTVCGPGGLADNVREAVRDVQDQGSISFIEESFTW